MDGSGQRADSREATRGPEALMPAATRIDLESVRRERSQAQSPRGVGFHACETFRDTHGPAVLGGWGWGVRAL